MSTRTRINGGDKLKLEQRTVSAQSLEVRAEGEARKISGLGIVYNAETRLYEDLYEVIRPGAATAVLAGEPDIRSAFNHSRDHILGRTKSGTLELEETPEGVRYTVLPPDASWARDLMASMERGDIDGSSFTFGVDPQDEKVTKRDDGTYLREIFRLSALGEMGPVTAPAYPTTTANVRSAQDIYDSTTASLRAQDDAVKTASQRALELRNRKLNHIIRSEQIEDC